MITGIWVGVHWTEIKAGIAVDEVATLIAHDVTFLTNSKINSSHKRNRTVVGLDLEDVVWIDVHEKVKIARVEH